MDQLDRVPRSVHQGIPPSNWRDCPLLTGGIAISPLDDRRLLCNAIAYAEVLPAQDAEHFLGIRSNKEMVVIETPKCSARKARVTRLPLDT
jgi:hypothetical protein